MSDRPLRSVIRSGVKVLRSLRAVADERVNNRCAVLGSMIGVKIKRGVVQPRLCITYLVQEKIPLDDLSPRERIPQKLTIDGQRVLTDVVVWPKMELQSLRHGRYIRDEFTQGTLTAFAESPDGLWGLSCGHCMLGSDGLPYTATNIYMQDSDSGQFIVAGKSGLILFAPSGEMISGSRGFLDCGLFGLTDELLRSRAQNAPALALSAPYLNQRLKAVSLMQVGSVIPGPRSAEVIGVDQYGVDDNSDVVLRVDAPGTVSGDSGLLWLTANGLAAAIHSRGEIVPTGQGSFLTAAMSAQRACQVLNVALRSAF